MRTSLLTTMLALVGLAFPAGATAQTDYHDITALYLANSGFDEGITYGTDATGNAATDICEVQSWTRTSTVTYNILGTYAFGTKRTFNGASVPATGEDGTAQGGALALNTAQQQQLHVAQDVLLPAGKYMIVAALYNCNASYNGGTSLTAFLPTGGTATTSKLTPIPSATWTLDTVRFELTATTAGKIRVGLKASKNKSTECAQVVIDWVRLLRDTPAGSIDVDAQKQKLADLISEAEELLAKKGNSSEAEALREAVARAQALIANDSATIDDVRAMIDELNSAISALELDSVRITTNKRHARGSVWAFGRMTLSGIAAADIAEQGFCYAAGKKLPTISDSKHAATLTNNGTIYWLKDLTPSTLYYMRPFVTTKTGKTKYGEPTKFYTLPKGQITYTIRDGDAEPTARIRAAMETAVNGYWNNLTEMKGFSPNVGYESGTPTADCSYGGWMRVGSSQSYQKPGTMMHEMLHGCGVIPWADTEWSRHTLRSGVNGDGYGTGQWLGERVTEVLRFLENNETEVLSGDYQHMWPYGINGANEDNGSEMLYIGNGLVCQALGEDGLQHTYQLFAEPYYALDQEDDVKYYLKSEDEAYGRYSAYLRVSKSGKPEWAAMGAAEATSNDSAAWYITFTPKNQYYQLRNAATGAYLTYTADGVTMQTAAVATQDNSWHVMRGRIDADGRRGYWFIHPTSDWTPPCLTAKAKGATATETFNIKNEATQQRWLVISEDEMESYEGTIVELLRKAATLELTPIKALANVPHRENAEGTDRTFTDELAAIETVLATSGSPAELKALTERAMTAARNFLAAATPTDSRKPFDLTFFIKNAGIDSAEGWSEQPTINYSCGEFYQKAFDMKQRLTDMPAGTYRLKVQAFQRPGTSEGSYTDFASGKNNVTAYAYVNTTMKKIQHIAEGAQKRQLGGTEKAVGNDLYIPNDMKAASIYFDRNYYDNEVTMQLAAKAPLSVGLRSSVMNDSYWCMFDNFRLYFYGALTPDEVDAIASVAADSLDQPADVYSIDGRLLHRKASATSLPKGIYIIGSKKVVVK